MKIKNIIIIAIITLIALVAIICVTNNNISKYASNLPFNSDSQVMAIFFLGGLESSYDYEVVNKYYTKDDIESFENIGLEGEECYLIVPRYKGNVTVSLLSMAEDGGTDVEHIKEANKPFFLKCNVSDIFPNSEIKLVVDDKEYVYTPYVSLKDGSIVTEQFVLLVEE